MESPNTDTVHSRYNLRPNRVPSYAHHVLYIGIKEAVDKYGEVARDSIQGELLQMINKGVWRLVHRHQVTHGFKVIPSKMFLKEKFTAEEKFDKLKARLVAGGHMQDKAIYEYVSSPTAATTSVMMVADIAAREGRNVVTADITGAYLNADMGDVEVFMRLAKPIAALLLELDPNKHSPYVSVQLLKALYGCVEAAKLWHEHISATLSGVGYVANPLDTCIVNWHQHGVQSTVCVYVDDLLITSTSKDMTEQTISALRNKYNTLTVKEGKEHK